MNSFRKEKPRQARVIVSKAGVKAEPALESLQRGEYLVASMDVTKRVTAPTKRLFHLGDVKHLSSRDHAVLAKYGIASSNDLRAVGLGGLELLRLSPEGFASLVETFDALDMPVPSRGSLPRKATPMRQKAIRREFDAYRLVWRTKEKLRESLDAPVSSFVSHRAGFDVVCGACGRQHLSIQEDALLQMVCGECGNDLGVDFIADKERLSFTPKG